MKFQSERDLPEHTTHSFLLRVWLEERDEATGRATWRGSITHVASGTRKYLQNLHDISTFVRPYLQAMGAEFNRWGWARKLLHRLGLP